MHAWQQSEVCIWFGEDHKQNKNMWREERREGEGERHS